MAQKHSENPTGSSSVMDTPARQLVHAKDLGVWGRSRDTPARQSNWIIRHVNLVLHAGEILTLVGPNGGGKSTTVRALLGLIDPDEGSVQIQPGLKIGYVPQKLSIDPTLPLTVNRFMGLTNNPTKHQIAMALEQTGVSYLHNSPMQALSGGEFQRVLLARAIAFSPQILVLDEPVSGVDVQGERALYKLIDEIRHELDCGILLVSHDLHVVMAQSDRVICLNGHVCCQGSPGEVLGHENYKTLYNKQDAEFVAFYEHDHDHSHDVLGHDHHEQGEHAEISGSISSKHGEIPPHV